jgi:pimeloyl-ACP methyl ester carboxylesterase
MHLHRSAVHLSRSLAAGLLAVTALSTATAAAPAAAAGTAPPGAARVPVLAWRACDGSFQCATARVPLNYRYPRGPMISIAVISHRATDPARRIGSLFFNPGGPGDPGVASLPSWYPLFPARVRARFDIISFDPRGVGDSTAVRCFATTAAEDRFLAALPGAFPVGARQVAVWDRTWARFDARCGQRNKALLPHVTTADVARDMDLLRRAVGDPAMNYLGISYGTLLGATYANLFPGRVRSMVLDGNVDPVAWTHANRALPATLRIGGDLASAATLRAFLRLCGRAPTASCAFSAGTPAATAAKFGALMHRLRQHPVTIGNPPQTFTYASTVALVVQTLYTIRPLPPLADIGTVGWPGGAKLLQRLWAASGTHRHHAAAAAPVRPAPALGHQASGRTATAAAAVPAVYNGPEQEFAVACSDSPNPQDPRSYPAFARLATARSGVVGPYWAWLTETCADWPAAASADRYAGPWNRPTAHPVLVIGNTFDPSTRYQSSVAMSHDLARARLLTVDGYGHTELANPSNCAARYETRYLIAGSLPPPGTVCRQNTTPFPPATSRH